VTSLSFVEPYRAPVPPDYSAIRKASDNRIAAEQAEAARLEAVQREQQAEADRQAAIVQQAAYAAPAQVTDHIAVMAAAGIAPGDYGYVDFIVTHESGWRVDAQAPNGPYGLCQSWPGDKMAAAGTDWQTNPVTQIEWCSMHAQQYGGWYGSYLFWLAHSAW
jgi:hypothetical protein